MTPSAAFWLALSFACKAGYRFASSSSSACFNTAACSVRTFSYHASSALAEMGVALPTSAAAAATVVFQDLAELCLSGRASERWVVQKVEEIVGQADYSDDVLDLPLGTLYGTDDAWDGGWGPPVEARLQF